MDPDIFCYHALRVSGFSVNEPWLLSVTSLMLKCKKIYYSPLFFFRNVSPRGRPRTYACAGNLPHRKFYSKHTQENEENNTTKKGKSIFQLKRGKTVKHHKQTNKRTYKQTTSDNNMATNHYYQQKKGVGAGAGVQKMLELSVHSFHGNSSV